jgi:ribonuclease HI
VIYYYTDGSCWPNPGNGGWAVVVVNESGNVVDKFSGAAKDTTNQRMELTGCLCALQTHTGTDLATVITDSNYVVGCLSGWRISKNHDLASRIRKELKRIGLDRVRWRRVKGHSGNKYNELADQLALKARIDGTHLQQIQ